MKLATWIGFSLVLLSPLASPGGDRNTLSKQLAKIDAVCTDPNGRRVASRLISDQFHVPHQQIPALRRELNLNYGSTFLFYELGPDAAGQRQLSSDLKTGKNLLQVGTERQVEWGKLTARAKDFNKRLREGLYDYFMHLADIRAKDTAENYLPMQDLVPADRTGFSQGDLDEARAVFHQQQLRAHAQDPDNRTIDEMSENQVRHSHDPVRDGAPRIDIKKP